MFFIRREVITLNLKGWRTMLVFGIQAVVYLLAWDKIATVIDPFYLIEGNAVAAMVLRWITTGPVGKGG